MADRKSEHSEAGRRLYAAIISMQMGVSLDWAYRKYTPKTVGQGWCDLAWELQKAMTAGIAEEIRSAMPKPFLV